MVWKACWYQKLRMCSLLSAGSVPEAVANDCGAGNWWNLPVWVPNVCHQLHFSGRKSWRKETPISNCSSSCTLQMLYKTKALIPSCFQCHTVTVKVCMTARSVLQRQLPTEFCGNNILRYLLKVYAMEKKTQSSWWSQPSAQPFSLYIHYWPQEHLHFTIMNIRS